MLQFHAIVVMSVTKKKTIDCFVKLKFSSIVGFPFYMFCHAVLESVCVLYNVYNDENMVVCIRKNEPFKREWHKGVSEDMQACDEYNTSVTGV